MDIPKSEINLIDLHTKGQQSLDEERAVKEREKLGYLRGGNSGCLTDDGRVLGKCHRLSYLRMLGIEKAPPANKQLMFAAGLANEDLWVERLERAWNGAIKCEEDIPIRWETTNGTPVTGRPDIVLCDATETELHPLEGGQDLPPRPVLGLELKLISSPYSAYNYVAKNRPFLDHAIQACHYSWKLEIPYKLVYTSRTNYMTGYGGMKNRWKESPEFLTEGEHKADPLIRVYDLMIKNDRLYYQGPNHSEPMPTDITTTGIERYYENVSRIAERKGLGPRPEAVEIDGSDRSWTACNYCPFQQVCDKYEDDHDRWLDEIKLKITLDI